MKTYIKNLLFILSVLLPIGLQAQFTMPVDTEALMIKKDTDIMIDRNSWRFDGTTPGGENIEFGVFGEPIDTVRFSMPLNKTADDTFAMLSDLTGGGIGGIYGGSGSLIGCTTACGAGFDLSFNNNLNFTAASVAGCCGTANTNLTSTSGCTANINLNATGCSGYASINLNSDCGGGLMTLDVSEGCLVLKTTGSCADDIKLNSGNNIDLNAVCGSVIMTVGCNFSVNGDSGLSSEYLGKDACGVIGYHALPTFCGCGYDPTEILVTDACGVITTTPEDADYDLTLPAGLGIITLTSGNGDSMEIGASVTVQTVGTGDITMIAGDPVTGIWQTEVSGTTNDLRSIAYNGTNQWIAVGANGTLLRSPDTINWVTVDLSTVLTGGEQLNAIAYDSGSGMYMAVGNTGTTTGEGVVITSTDGLVWAVQVPGCAGINLHDVVYDTTNNVWVAAGDTGHVLTSSNGVLWTPPATTGTVNNIYGLAFDPLAGRTVAVGASGTILETTTPAGLWTAATSPSGNDLWASVFSGSLFSAVGDSGTALYDADGVGLWTAATSSGTVNNLRDVAHDGTDFLAVGFAGTIIRSADGDSWATEASSTASDLWGVINGSFVGVGNTGTIVTLQTERGDFIVEAEDFNLDADGNQVNSGTIQAGGNNNDPNLYLSGDGTYYSIPTSSFDAPIDLTAGTPVDIVNDTGSDFYLEKVWFLADVAPNVNLTFDIGIPADPDLYFDDLSVSTSFADPQAELYIGPASHNKVADGSSFRITPSGAAATGSLTIKIIGIKN
jgi:hypothetical protein